MLCKIEPQLSVDFVNKHFASVGKNLAATILSETAHEDLNKTLEVKAQDNSFGMLRTDESEVLGIINSLKKECAVGYDGISNKMLKLANPIMVPLITHICNLSLDTGIFPSAFKTSIITPVHKGGKGDGVGNYRPISVLTALSKILEKIINKRLITYLEKYNILSPNQFGFRAARSTEAAVTGLIDLITTNMDKKKKVIGIFLDLAKAFDTVSTPILIKKLELIGIRDISLKLLADYLTDRFQKTKIGNFISGKESMTYGVPQGSVLGPTLFLVYVNDLCNLELVNGKIFSYADDTACIFEGKTWEEARTHAEVGLKVVMKWLQHNLLTLNIEKTKFMTFTNACAKKPDLTIRAHHNCSTKNDCSCQALERVDSTKYLGLIIDEKLNWKKHVEVLAKRIRKLIYIFKYLREVADRKLILNIYDALCKSLLAYCNVTWGGACVTYMLKLERAQRAVLKVATFKPFRFPTESLYSECEVLTVRKLFVYNILLSQHKSIDPNDNLSSGRRKKDKIVKTPKCNTTFAQRQQFFLRPFLYNKASKEIPNLVSSNKKECKISLKEWLIGMTYDETEKLLKVIQ